MGDGNLNRMDGDYGDIRHLVTRDILGQFEVHRSRTLLHRRAERIAHHGRNAGGTDDLS